MLPSYIRSASDLSTQVVFGVTSESLVLEFKRCVNWSVPKGTPEREKAAREVQLEICRDIAQFANTDGGCLLIGIDEDDKSGAPFKTARAVVSVDRPDALKQWIESAIRKFLVPATFSRDIVPMATTEGVVLAINVMPSRHAVSLWDGQGIEYLWRTSHGKEWMNPDEVERHIMNGSRATRIAVETAWKAAAIKEVVIADGCWHRQSGVQDVPIQLAVTIRTLGMDCVELRFSDGLDAPLLSVPFDVVQAVWVGSDSRLHLLLSLRVVRVGGVGLQLTTFSR